MPQRWRCRKKYNHFAAAAAVFLNDFLMEVRVDPKKSYSLLLEKEKVGRRCCERILTRHHLAESKWRGEMRNSFRIVKPSVKQLTATLIR